MDITFAPRGILQIDGASICFRNFEGREDTYNRAGDRNFAWVIPDKELADRLVDDGWNVKIREPKDEGDEPFMYLPVKVKFNERGPAVYITSGSVRNKLDEDSVGILDNIDILSVDMDIRPYDWGPIGKEEKYGRTAYLQSIDVVQEIDRFEERYRRSMNEEMPFTE